MRAAYHRRHRFLAQITRPRPLAIARETLFDPYRASLCGLSRKSFAHEPQTLRFAHALRVRDEVPHGWRLLHWLLSGSAREIAQHMKGNASSTAHLRPWKLIYYEAYLEQADAIGRERYLKSGAGRRFLRAQLANYLKRNPLTPTA